MEARTAGTLVNVDIAHQTVVTSHANAQEFSRDNRDRHHRGGDTGLDTCGVILTRGDCTFVNVGRAGITRKSDSARTDERIDHVSALCTVHARVRSALVHIRCTVGSGVPRLACAGVAQEEVSTDASVLARAGVAFVQGHACCTLIRSREAVVAIATVRARASVRTHGVDRVAVVFRKSTPVDRNATVVAAPATVAVTDVTINVIHTRACTVTSRQRSAWATAR